MNTTKHRQKEICICCFRSIYVWLVQPRPRFKETHGFEFHSFFFILIFSWLIKKKWVRSRSTRVGETRVVAMYVVCCLCPQNKSHVNWGKEFTLCVASHDVLGCVVTHEQSNTHRFHDWACWSLRDLVAFCLKKKPHFTVSYVHKYWTKLQVPKTPHWSTLVSCVFGRWILIKGFKKILKICDFQPNKQIDIRCN